MRVRKEIGSDWLRGEERAASASDQRLMVRAASGSCVGGLDVSDDALMEQIMNELDLDP